jgi:hypothetical protein
MAFEAGKSGNPGGRPKEKPFREALNLAITDAGDDRRKLREIAAKLLDKAAEGDIQAIREVADRLDGKPAQENVHEGPGDGGEIIVENIYRWMPRAGSNE